MNITRNKRPVDIEKIVIKFKDGTEEEIIQGAVLDMDKDGEDVSVTIKCANLSGEDFRYMMYAFINGCEKIGAFDGIEMVE